MKSYTDLEQSKVLSEILPHESADIHYWKMDWETYCLSVGHSKELQKGFEAKKVEYIPCWSLAALLEQLPYEICDDDGNSSYLQIDKWDDMYQLVYTDPYEVFESIETDRYENFVDACCELILKLNKLNLL